MSDQISELYRLATYRKAAIIFLVSIIAGIFCFSIEGDSQWLVITARCIIFIFYSACVVMSLINDTVFDISDSLKNKDSHKSTS